MSLFKGLQIGLDLGCSLNFKKKTELRKAIVENRGIISYIVTKHCHIVVTSDPEKCDVSSKCRMAIKYGLPVLRLDYIWDSLDAGKLLPYDSYVVGGKSKILDFKSGKISAFSRNEKPKKYNSKPAFNPRSVKIWTANDTNQPRFNEESHEVAKYAVFMGYSSSLKCQNTAILELHTPPLLSGLHNKSEVAMDDGSTQNLLLYRVVFQSGCHKDLEAGKPCHMEIRYMTMAEQALAVFAMLHEDVDKKGELTRCRRPVRGVGSQKLQKLMAEVVDVDNDSSDEVKELVDHIWREAMAEVTSVLGDIRKIKLEQVDKAEAILVKVRDALKASSSGKTVNNLIEDFYSALPHMQEVPNVSDTKRWLASKQDMCQLIKDMMAVSEMTNYETRAYVEAKYAALRCRITHLKEIQKNDIVNLIHSSLESAVQNLHILNVFEVWRWTEDLDFRHDLGRKELLFHSSKVENFVGILSRGLLLPKIIVDDFGGQRTDAGMLGSGIYFASAASKSMRYSSPSKTKGSRLLLVNEVALGSCKDIIKHDTTLVAPPEGYDSTHGVSRKWDKSSEFENDEFVVYSVNQQRIRYLVEFTMQEDIVRPLKKIDTVDTSAICDSVENASLQDVAGIADPMLKVKPGLIGAGGREVELRCVHIRAKLVDMAAQVVVLQEYYNNSQQAIEAKYVFPLDDAAAVCGFEAFINGKHIVGTVKEKEVAHKEYQQAISEGHGAYLMDQDEETPDMFTVSVGNLPACACVLIKITYVAELQIEEEKISFLLPAAVAPWKEEAALKLSTQDKLESYKMSATRTTVQVAVEMPFEIRSLHCPTHKIRVKQTASKAYVEMVNNQKFGAGFQLLIGLAEIHLPRMWVERHSGDKEHQACMLIFYPEFESSEVVDGEVTLMLDVSNSMKGTPLLEAKKVALLILQNLPPGWSFNVARFGSDYEEVFPAPKRSIEANLQYAIQFVQNSTADKGNTDIMRPLKPLFLLPRADKQRNVFLISDGHINDAEVVLHCAKQNSSHTRLFSFGVSATCNNYTMKAMSRVSGGAFEYFNSKTKSKWEPKVKSQISKAGQPGLTSVNVEWHQYNDNLPATVQAPQQITALFSGSHQVIYGFVPDCTMATLTAEVDGQRVSTVVSTSELSITEGVLVHRLTAKAIIRDWNDGILSRDRTEHEVAKMDLKSYIIDLSKEYSVVTQFTSFIAVEKREENEKDLPKEGPRIEELVTQENVDFLNYMGWTHIPEDDSLAILSVFDELSQEVNEQVLSNKMICQLNSMEEKYKKLQQQMGPCDLAVLTCATTLTQAYGLTGDTNRAASLAQTAYEEAVGNISSLTKESDYTKLADILADLKEKVVDFKGQEQTQMASIPFPASGNGKIYIRTPAGSELTFPCNGLLTVHHLKRLIWEYDMTPMYGQKLVFQGKPLEDFVSLADLNIGYGDRIRLEISQPEQPTDNRFNVVHGMCAELSNTIPYLCFRRDADEVAAAKEALEKMRAVRKSRKSRNSTMYGGQALELLGAPALFTFCETPKSSSRTFGGPSPKADMRSRGYPGFRGAHVPASFGSPPAASFGAPAPASFGAPAPASFGALAPASFGAPAPASFGAPAPASFGAPPPPGFGAPVPASFGAPTPASFGPPAPPGFAAPPPPGFGAPPPPDIGAQQPSVFGASASSILGAPAPPDFGAPPPPDFGAQQLSFFGASASSILGAPAPDFGTSESNLFGAQTSGFGVQPPSDCKTSSSVSITPSSADFGAPGSFAFRIPSASPGFRGQAPVDPIIAIKKLLSSEEAGVAATTALFRAPEPLGFKAISRYGYKASPPSDVGTPAPPVFAVQKASAAFRRPTHSASFEAPIAKAPFEASQEVVSQASSASVGGLFGAAPRESFEASPEVVSQASVGRLFRAAPRALFEASPEVVSQASSAFVGGLFEESTPLAPVPQLRLGQSMSRRAFQASQKRLPLGTPEALNPSATFGALTHLTSREAPEFLEILADATGPQSYQLVTPITQHETVSESRSRTSTQGSPLVIESTTGSLFRKESTPHPESMRNRNLPGALLSQSELVSFLSNEPPPVHLDGLGRRYKQFPQMGEYTGGFQQIEQMDECLEYTGGFQQIEQMDECLVNQSESSREFKNMEPLKYEENVMEKSLKRKKKKFSSKGREFLSLGCHFEDFDSGDLFLDEVMDNELLENERSCLDICPGPAAVENRIRQEERLMGFLDENVTYGKMVADSEDCFSSRLHLQFLDTDKSDLSLMTSGEKCIRARGIQLKVDDLDILLDCQTEQGSWKLGDQLDQLLGISSHKCQRILVANGLRSLGKTASEHIEELIATILVLFSITEFLKPGLLPTEASAGTLSKAFDHLKEGFDDEAWRKFSLSPEKVQKLKEAIRKAYMFCCKTERMHPCVYSILELGRNWVNVATAFLQPCAA